MVSIDIPTLIHGFPKKIYINILGGNITKILTVDPFLILKRFY